MANDMNNYDCKTFETTSVPSSGPLKKHTYIYTSEKLLMQLKTIEQIKKTKQDT